MKFINTLEENRGDGGDEKVSLGSRQRVRGVRVGTPGWRVQGWMQGWRERWRHTPVQFMKSFVPQQGREQGTPVFYGGEVLSFHSQSF